MSSELQKLLEGSIDSQNSTSQRQPDRYPKCRFLYALVLSTWKNPDDVSPDIYMPSTLVLDCA